MKKVELLSPVGDMETLYYAVHNGADAVYLGGKKFGARKFAKNFDEEGIKKAVRYCHLYGVKIYVTVNTMIHVDEMQEALDYVRFLHIQGVDAIIVQDLGFMITVRRMFPNLDVHMSTQAHNCNDQQLEHYLKVGVKRVVLARELSLKEIKALECPIEKEVFVHGALCVSYSGNCLFSSMNGGRSGNRGECAGCCRLPFSLECDGKTIDTDGEYLLSTKSLCTLEKVPELIKAGITSFKIEGRMKSKEYVGYVTRAYRRAIDAYYNNEKNIDLSEYLLGLKKLYSREFTKGYLFNEYGNGVMNIKTSNHVGIPLGEVINVTRDKIKIRLEEELNQEDGIRFPNGEGMIVNFLYNEKGLLVSNVQKGEVALVDNKVSLTSLGVVQKTLDKKFLDDLRNYEEKKIKVHFEFVGKVDERMTLTLFDDDGNKIFLRGSNVEEANSSPTTKERVIEQLSKLGNTPFVLADAKVNIDKDIFIPIKEINDLRRLAVQRLRDTRELKKKTFKSDKDYRTSKYYIYPNFELNVAVRNEEQLKCCIEEGIASIYVSDLDLYKKYSENSSVFYRTKRVPSIYPDMVGKKILATEFGACCKYVRENYVVGDYFLNIANDKTISYLYGLGLKKVTLSPELSDEVIEKINYRCCPVEMIVYGRLDLMFMKYCPLNMLINKDEKRCSLCSKGKQYYLKNKQNERFPIVNEKHYTHILHHKNRDILDKIPKYKKLGIKCYRIELFDENKDELKELLDRAKRIVSSNE